MFDDLIIEKEKPIKRFNEDEIKELVEKINEMDPTFITELQEGLKELYKSSWETYRI